MRLQPFSAKLGEIKYRAKIVNQQLGKTRVFDDEPSASDFQKILKSKLRDTERTFRALSKQGLTLTPYLEIGSEHCLRPALLELKFGAQGFATDISLYSLTNAPEFIKKFNFKKVPRRICCDAYLLPFKSNSFPFIFIYETLHHFPNPLPILKEAKRVLAPGGLLLIGADPIKAQMQLTLWRRPTKLRLWEKLLKAILILPFISHIGKTEVDHGILEEAFTLDVWQKALDIFDKVEVTLRAFPFGPEETVIKNDRNDWIVPGFFTHWALRLFGGGLTARCLKSVLPQGNFSLRSKDNFENLLICPNCLKKDKVEINLTKDSKAKLICPKCQNQYNKYSNVLVLLEKSLSQKVILKK